ncbi:hypothetical protein MACK_003853 [Theileria orientalis]|uniref:Prefoldin subunit n=1 Tax=Theileria orientalis TaxID=68886 RepID=A0A976SJ07_THEOR|nr:hypothetical protein MACK_003853 [Theileria orientalis]
MENSDSNNTLRVIGILFCIQIHSLYLFKINKHINNQKIKNKKAQVALESLGGVDESKKVYKQVSRLLVLRNKSELRKELEAERESSENDLPKLESIKNQLVAKLGGLNSQLLEINKQIRQQATVGTAQ